MWPVNSRTVAAIARMLSGSVSGRSLASGLACLISPARINPQLPTPMPRIAPSRCAGRYTSSGTRPTRADPAAAAMSRARAPREAAPLPQQRAVSSTPAASSTPRATSETFMTWCSGEQT